MKTKEKIRYLSNVFFTIIFLFSCTNQTKNPQESPAEMSSYLASGETMYFSKYDGKYISINRVYYESKTFYVEIKANLPYAWGVNDEKGNKTSHYYVHYSDSTYDKELWEQAPLFGILNADKKESEYLESDKEITGFLYYKMSKEPIIEKCNMLFEFSTYAYGEKYGGINVHPEDVVIGWSNY